MAGNRRGGTPGNLNAAGPAGIARAFARNRTVRKQDRWVLPLLEQFVRERTEDLGGPDAVSAGQKTLIATSAVCAAMIALILSASREDGLVTKDADGNMAVTPAGREIPKLLARIQAAEVALGVEKKQTTKETLASVLRGPVVDVKGEK